MAIGTGGRPGTSRHLEEDGAESQRGEIINVDQPSDQEMELPMWRQRLVKSRPASRIALTCATLWVLGLAPTGAQDVVPIVQTGFEVHSGLMHFLSAPRRSAAVTVTELGARGVASTVRIFVYGPDDQLLARHQDTLLRGQPVTFTYQIQPTTPSLLRFSVVIFGVAGRDTQPVIVLEDVDGDAFTIGQRFSCAQPAHREGPVTPFCTGVIVRDIAFGG